MRLDYFDTKEFRGQKGLIDPRLLVKIDVYRFMWGNPVDISPHPKAIGREDGTSQHNYKRYGKIRAIDLMPRGIESEEDARSVVQIALAIGFTGVGFYPHWRIGDVIRPGIHLDVRDGNPETPATWGGIRVEGKQVYVTLEEALVAMKTQAGEHFGI